MLACVKNYACHKKKKKIVPIMILLIVENANKFRKFRKFFDLGPKFYCLHVRSALPKGHAPTSIPPTITSASDGHGFLYKIHGPCILHHVRWPCDTVPVPPSLPLACKRGIKNAIINLFIYLPMLSQAKTKRKEKKIFRQVQTEKVELNSTTVIRR